MSAPRTDTGAAAPEAPPPRRKNRDLALLRYAALAYLLHVAIAVASNGTSFRTALVWPALFALALWVRRPLGWCYLLAALVWAGVEQGALAGRGFGHVGKTVVLGWESLGGPTGYRVFIALTAVAYLLTARYLLRRAAQFGVSRAVTLWGRGAVAVAAALVVSWLPSVERRLDPTWARRDIQRHVTALGAGGGTSTPGPSRPAPRVDTVAPSPVVAPGAAPEADEPQRAGRQPLAQPLRVLRHPYAVFSVAWSPDGTQIAVGGMLDPRVSIWDPHGGTLLRTLGDRSGGVAALAYYPNGRFLAVGRGFVGADHLSIDVFDARTGGFVRALPGPSTVRGRNNVSALAASSNGRYLAAGYFATVVLYDAVTGQPIRSLALPEKQSTTWVALAFSPAGTLLAGGATGGTVQLWEVTTGASVSTIEGHSDAVRALAFSPDGSHLASGTRTGNTSGKVDESTRQFVRRTTYDPIRIWDAGTGKLIRGLPGHTWHVQALLFSRSGERLFSGSGDRSLRIWSAGTGSLLETSTGHGDQVWSLASSPDDTLLASAGGSAVTIWRLRKDSE